MKYAWFTMSREVEVKGINVTATVPENLQISAGHLTSGYLTGTMSGTMLATIKSPSDAQESKDWSNFVVFSDFYEFGRLTPATSTTGVNMWYTKDATGAGKTLKGQTLTSDGVWDSVNGAGDTISAVFTDAADEGYMASALIKDGSETLTDSYEKGGAYYIDIPVWFRSSHDGEMTLAVKATVSNADDDRADFTNNGAGSRNDDDNSDDLINAVRVSILSGADFEAETNQSVAGTENTGVQGVLTGTDGYQYYSETANQRPETGTHAAPKTVADFDADDGITWGNVTYTKQFTAAEQAQGYAAAAGADAKTAVVTVPAGDANEYGDPVRYTIRVWIDGEDEDCYNSTAGQNFTVALNFIQIGNTIDTVRG